MPHLVHGHDEAICAWAERIFASPIAGPRLALGIITDDGTLQGALALSLKNATTADLTVLSSGVITPKIAKGFFRWCFDDVGVYRLEVKTAKTNKAIKKAAPKFGFQFEGTAKNYYGPNRDALCFYMTPDTCRWIGKNGRLARRTAV